MGTARVLDAALVEDLHHLILDDGDAGRIAAAITSIGEVTLTGLVEYGCLRWQQKNLPTLPDRVMQSPLGRAISEAGNSMVRAAIAARSSDEDMKPRQCEFVFFRSEEDLLSDRLKFFCIRFAKSAQAAGFRESVFHALQAGLDEMMNNAVQHAHAPAPIVAGYAANAGTATFVVADVGRGVLESLRSSPKYAHLTGHAEAVSLAVHDGVTSSDDQGGRGFNDLFKALAEQWGLLRFRSGNGCYTVDGRGANADSGKISFPPPLLGFQVSVSCSTNGSSSSKSVL